MQIRVSVYHRIATGTKMDDDIDQCIQTTALVASLLSSSSSKEDEKRKPRGSRPGKKANLERNFEAVANMLHGQYFADHSLYDSETFNIYCDLQGGKMKRQNCRICLPIFTVPNQILIYLSLVQNAKLIKTLNFII